MLLTLFADPTYNITLPRIKQSQKYINTYLCNWFGVLPMFIDNGNLYQYQKPANFYIVIAGGVQGREVTPSHDYEGLSRCVRLENTERYQNYPRCRMQLANQGDYMGDTN